MSREKFQKATRLREKEIEIPEVGIVRIREFTVAQRLAFMEYIERGEDGRAKFGPEKQVRFDDFIISLGVIKGDVAKDGEQGDLMYGSIDDVPEMRFDVKEKITAEILCLSGIQFVITNPDQLAGEVAANPPKGGTSSSTSDTPSPSS